MSTILKIDNLTGGYPNKEDIVKDISLNIESGDFVGIIGPNGSGKTTLLRLISRVNKPKKGTVFFKGKDIYKINLKDFCRQIAFVSQKTSSTLKVLDFVLMGRIPHLGRLQIESKKDIDIAEKSLGLTDALELKEKNVDELSAGEQQRVAIARALAQEPELLFLDEPTSHLDVGHQIQILDLLKKLNKQNNLTILMIQHDLNLASSYCSRIALLNDGSVYKEGSPQDVLTYQNIEAVYKTIVLVGDNPATKKPNIILVPGVT